MQMTFHVLRRLCACRCTATIGFIILISKFKYHIALCYYNIYNSFFCMTEIPTQK